MKIKAGLESDYKRYVKINSEDEYSKVVVDTGELVGIALDAGRTGEEALKEMSGHALTGFMAAMVVKAVAHFHPRGADIASAWNKDWGAPDLKGGIVNPAILTIEDDGSMTPEIERV